MNISVASALSSPAAARVSSLRASTLSPNAAFYLQMSMLVSFLAGSSVPTPLYSLYQAEWGFSPVTLTAIFGIYAVAVLAALLTFGSLSDYIGRRPVLIGATLVQAATMLLFTTATGVNDLLVARIVQGLATGAAAGAVGAAMMDIDRVKGPTANAVASMMGTGLGSIVSGLMIAYLPSPTHTVYLVLLAIFIAQAVGASLMPETATPRPGALASLKPRFNLPKAVRQPLLLGIPVLIAAWALAGFYGSLGPAVVRNLLGSSSSVMGGLTLFALAGSGATAVLLLQNLQPRRMMVIGASALLAGVSVTLIGMEQASVAVFFAGAVVTGAGFGTGFQGAVRSVVMQAGPQERAGVLSIVYVVCYLAMGVPAVIAGLMIVHGGGVLATAEEYGAAVMGLAALALAGTALRKA